MQKEPLTAKAARELLRTILNNGVVTYAVPHAMQRLRERKLSMIDCENVMRGGVVEEAEWEHGAWRHKVRTPKIEVIVQFLSEDEVLIVTAWRKR